MWYVYVLKSTVTDFIYIGSTNNIERRLLEHNSGKVKSTKPYFPFNLNAYVAVRNENKARELEKYFNGLRESYPKKKNLDRRSLT